jgi:hypothetical protein
MPTMGKNTARPMDEVLDETVREGAAEEGKDAL